MAKVFVACTSATKRECSISSDACTFINKCLFYSRNRSIDVVLHVLNDLGIAQSKMCDGGRGVG